MGFVKKGDNMDILKLYMENAAVKEYIDKYSNKRRISVEEAAGHIIVKQYVEWMKEKGKL